MIEGLYTAMITPFKNDGSLDLEGFKKNINFQIEAGVNGLLPLGTTGETPTLNQDERKILIKTAVAEVAGRVPVMIGCGSNNTQTTIENSKLAKELGADSALVVTPYYNKPTQEGIFQHFKAVTEAVDIPVIVYNIQSRTGTNIATATLKRMTEELRNIVAVKESSQNVCQVADVINDIPKLSVLSGDDAFTLPILALGGKGAISVVSNLLPEQTLNLINAAKESDFQAAQKAHYALLPFLKALFLESNPIPVKQAMELCGMSAGPCRLPLTPIQPENKAILKELCTQAKLIS